MRIFLRAQQKLDATRRRPNGNVSGVAFYQYILDFVKRLDVGVFLECAQLYIIQVVNGLFWSYQPSRWHIESQVQ